MSKSIRNLIIVIGSLSILSGVYQIYRGSEFSAYFMGIFLGITLIGTVILARNERADKES